MNRKGKWILAMAVILTIIGGLLSRWHLWAIDAFKAITTPEGVDIDLTSVALGGLLLSLAPFLFRLAKVQGEE